MNPLPPLSMPALSRWIVLLAVAVTCGQLRAQNGFKDIPTDPKPGDALLAEYFAKETKRLTNRTLADIQTKEDWEAKKDNYRRQLFEMLGLQPLPKRTELKPVITGKVEQEDFTVENLHFQSRPGLYVTGNLYLPKNVEGPAPTILYVCGHGAAKKDGVSYGNKTSYQHHGEWFARMGYVCLTIDTLQMGEIEGIHHGTHRYDRWWWPARGYTSAGVEAWNCIRALDYLETRPEVDAKRMGVTGRSGGGAYSWWIAALDERIQVAVPVAGITSLHNHVVDGCVEGHCDCMYQVNTYRWDYPMIAALVAPRPLLIANTDKDRIFPLDGVVDVYTKARRVYSLLGAEDHIGLCIVEGPHKDTQPLRVPAFHWFERFLKGKEPTDTFELAATKLLEPTQLQVFPDGLPKDEKNTTIDETFTRVAKAPAPPATQGEWATQRDEWMHELKAKAFRGWPNKPEELNLTKIAEQTTDGITLTRYSFLSQSPYELRLYLVHREGLALAELDLAVLNALEEEDWNSFLGDVGAAFPKAFEGETLPELNKKAFGLEKRMYDSQKWAMAYVCPRGIGPTAWTDDAKERTHILRRFLLLGQTLDSMQTWDIRRAIQALRSIEGMSEVNLWLQSSGTMAGNTLYASLHEPQIHRLDLHGLPASHREGPYYLNVMRYLDTPQAVTMAAERSMVRLYTDQPGDWEYTEKTIETLGWEPKQFETREPVPSGESE